MPAAVLQEPGNQYDPNAVKVLVQNELVGYLPREVAAMYTGPLRDLSDRGEYLAERSQPYQAIEVRLDGQRVGVLTKAMSEKIADLVTYIAERDLVPVCRAVLNGSPLRAELVLHVAKSHEVTRNWLESVVT